MQQSDFEGIYEAMEGMPVTIRYLDPPLHEFLPTEEEDIELLAKDLGKSVHDIKEIIASLHEFNPMMGHRGCRLCVTYPEIAVMQTRAVIKAAIDVKKKHPDWDMVPEIMIPLVGEVKELQYVKKIVVETADALIKAIRLRPQIQGRHDDRDSARLRHSRRDRQGSRVLLLRHKRPHPDDLRLLP